MPRVLLAPSYGNPKSKKRYPSQGFANFSGSGGNPERDKMTESSVHAYSLVSGAFVREPAPDWRREYMLPVWRGVSRGQF
ncbi:hypothetical protein [Actinokineospora iranica]|uniref:Uncharacterized protein n=1 Tax=Actinokineospora iranica TaxID=1271860 RepID=A0A1G6J460_9PSEU|nr:hypothetical protein [Actinokineospora iranica]SDC13541.1 hypothetical protein SAMN05216174_101229 [Actinokineospora iranica]